MTAAEGDRRGAGGDARTRGDEEDAPGWDHDLPPEVPDPDDRARPRRHPSTIGGTCYLGVLLVVLVGVLLVWLVDWRVGVRVAGGALVAAAALRLGLPEREAGMLEVRSKPIDATLLAVPGAVLVVMASSIPDQPG